MKTNRQHLIFIAILFALIFFNVYYCSNSFKSKNDKLFSNTFLKKKTNSFANEDLTGRLKYFILFDRKAI